MNINDFNFFLLGIEHYESNHLNSILIETSIIENIKTSSLLIAYVNKNFIEIKSNIETSKKSILINSSKLFYYLYFLDKKYGSNSELNLYEFKNNIFKELEKNNNKGDFFNWIPDIYQLIAEINYHSAKLFKSMIDYHNNERLEFIKYEIDEFCYDICNYIIKIFQIYDSSSYQR